MQYPKLQAAKLREGCVCLIRFLALGLFLAAKAGAVLTRERFES